MKTIRNQCAEDIAVPTICVDERPGREGRRVPMTLVKRPSNERLREYFDYDEVNGLLTWKAALSNRTKAGDVTGRPMT